MVRPRIRVGQDSPEPFESCRQELGFESNPVCPGAWGGGGGVATMISSSINTADLLDTVWGWAQRSNRVTHCCSNVRPVAEAPTDVHPRPGGNVVTWISYL